MAIRRTKIMQFALDFHCFAEDTGINPAYLGDLIQLADKVASIQVSEHNSPNPTIAIRARNVCEAFNYCAKLCGFTAEFANIRPHISKNGRNYFLPSS